MSQSLVTRHALRRCTLLALFAGLAVCGGGWLAAGASANSRQVSIIEDGAALSRDPVGTMAQFRGLGANTIRVIIPWSYIAPKGSSSQKPRFNATDPNAYPAGNWAQYDAIVRAAKTDGITVDLTFAGAPRWAETQKPPVNNLNYA